MSRKKQPQVAEVLYAMGMADEVIRLITNVESAELSRSEIRR